MAYSTRGNNRRRRPAHSKLLRGAVLAAVISALPAFGGTETWLGGPGEWTSAVNWSPSVVPNAVDQGAIFQAGAGGTVTIASPVTVGNLTFNNTAGAYTLAGLAGGTLTFSSTTGNATILVTSALNSAVTNISVPLVLASTAEITNNGPSLTIASTIGGSGGLIVDGTGAVTLATANNYTGITTISNGLLTINNPHALGSGSSGAADGTVVNNHGTFALGAGITLAGELVTVNPGGVVSAASTTGTYGGTVVMNGGAIVYGSFTGVLAGSGTFTTGSGTGVNFANLAGTGTYTGTLSVVGNTFVSTPTALSPFGRTSVDGGQLFLETDVSTPIFVNEGALAMYSGTLTSSTVTVSGGTVAGGVFANTLIMNGGALGYGLRADVGTTVIDGVLSGSGNFSAGAVTFAGSGSYTGTLNIVYNALVTEPAALSAAGTTTVTYGTLTLATDTSAPISVVGSSGEVQLNPGVALTGNTITVNAGSLTSVDSTGVYENLIVMNGGTLGNGISGGAATFAGGIAGSGNFSISGAVLAGTGSYTGTASFTGAATINSATALSAAGLSHDPSGVVNIATSLDAPLMIDGGTATVTAPITGTFFLDAGRLSLVPGGSLSNGSVHLFGGAAGPHDRRASHSDSGGRLIQRRNRDRRFGIYLRRNECHRFFAARIQQHLAIEQRNRLDRRGGVGHSWDHFAHAMVWRRGAQRNVDRERHTRGRTRCPDTNRHHPPGNDGFRRGQHLYRNHHHHGTVDREQPDGPGLGLRRRFR